MPKETLEIIILEDFMRKEKAMQNKWLRKYLKLLATKTKLNYLTTTNVRKYLIDNKGNRK